jgi:hypothetical protein
MPVGSQPRIRVPILQAKTSPQGDTPNPAPRQHGRIQLQVLDFLYRLDELPSDDNTHDEFVSVIDIAGPGASQSRIESVHRATRSLAGEGLLTLQDQSRQLLPVDRIVGRIRRTRGREGALAARLATSSDA